MKPSLRFSFNPLTSTLIILGGVLLALSAVGLALLGAFTNRPLIALSLVAVMGLVLLAVLRRPGGVIVFTAAYLAIFLGLLSVGYRGTELLPLTLWLAALLTLDGWLLRQRSIGGRLAGLATFCGVMAVLYLLGFFSLDSALTYSGAGLIQFILQRGRRGEQQVDGEA